jgi:tRNA (adenine57-N1/adenine58-N1)-methyltransferase catalytic subunit
MQTIPDNVPQSMPAASQEAPAVAAPAVEAPASPAAPFVEGEPVTIIDGKGRRQLAFPTLDGRIHVHGGFVEANALLGAQPGSRLRTSRNQIVVVYRATLEEYVLLMRRAATIIPPKDMAYMIQWADVFPSATVVEAGIGSGALTLGILRALGADGRLIAFELREDHANRAKKNVLAWPQAGAERLDVRLGDIYQELGTLRGVDRIILDVPEPHLTLPGAALALKPGGLIVAYVPTIRQIDTFVLAVLDHRGFADAEVAEVMVRPWVADRQRLRPELRITGHTGFLVRARRRGPVVAGVEVDETPEAAEPASDGASDTAEGEAAEL